MTLAVEYRTRISAQPAVNSAVDCILSADAFDAMRIRRLAQRWTYHETIAALMGELRGAVRKFRDSESLQSILFQRRNPELRIGRLAQLFCLADNWHASTLTLEEVREQARSERDPIAGRARLVLAALGELDWTRAHRRERAAFLIGKLVQARRERSF